MYDERPAPIGLRHLHGTDNYRRPSRFLSEIPKELIKQVR